MILTLPTCDVNGVISLMTLIKMEDQFSTFIIRQIIFSLLK
jgi:hypothetical protein